MPFLQVSSIHSIYYEEIGNPKGRPVLFVHGGPGYGCQPNDRDWFTSKLIRGILVDQRGAGRSLPIGELRENTAAHLVSDFEAIRKHFAIEAWHLFGGSWGTTLSLYYAQCHPTSVLSLTLRSVCLMDDRSVDWYMYDIGNFFPDAYLKFTQDVPDKYIQSNRLLEYYATQVLASSRPEDDIKWEQQWYDFEDRCVDPRIPSVPKHTPSQIRSLGRIECLYFRDCRLSLLENLSKITHIPTLIVHGRYDVLSPVANAFLVHRGLGDQSELHISEGSGHSARDPVTYKTLLSALMRIGISGSPLSV